jgi:hypothetical protein
MKNKEQAEVMLKEISRLLRKYALKHLLQERTNIVWLIEDYEKHINE